MNRYAGKRITIFGANRSGIAIARLLFDLGAIISLTDTRDSGALAEEISQLDGLQLQYYLGGHDESCIANAELIVVSPGVPLDIPILVEAKNRDISILGELEISASLCRAPIVAITGTKGKSTTTLLTAAILEKSNLFSSVVVAGNIGVPLASKVGTVTKNDIVVVEASSFQLESTDTFCPEVSVVLNVSRDHLDRHQTMDAYFNAKRKIYANQTEKDWIVLNASDPRVKGLNNDNDAKKAYFTDSLEHAEMELNLLCQQLESDIGARLQSKVDTADIYTFIDRQEHWICNTAEIPLAGAHNVRNTLASVVIGTIYGVKPTDIRNAILEFNRTHPALEHAYEKVSVINGVDYINDSKATNVLATYAALESIQVSSHQNGKAKRVYLIIGGFDKGNDYASIIELVNTKVKVLILLGEHTQNIQKELAGCAEMFHAATMEAAVEFAHNQATQGNIVLLSPANASFDMYTNYKERGEDFKRVVKSLDPKLDTKINTNNLYAKSKYTEL